MSDRRGCFDFRQSRARHVALEHGVNQSTVGVHKNNAIHNLHLATGKIGKPGCGPFSLTGQPNAMGGREAGGLSHMLPGYRSMENPQHRDEVECHWGVPMGSIAPKPGLAALEQFEAWAEGKVKAIWIICTNPAGPHRTPIPSRRHCAKRSW
jgi:ferredoxin-nitrate reductase